MKKKFVSKWLHRLPLLLLALVLAFMPLTMAAPAHADVLCGDTVAVFDTEIGQLTIPDLLTNTLVYYYQSSIGQPIRLVVLTSNDPIFSSAGTGVYEYQFDITNCYMYVAGFDSIPDGHSFVGMAPVFSASETIYVSEHMWFHYGSGFTGPVSALIPYTPVFVPVSPGVLSVFSGVGSWLSGAVQNISTMFWSAESGMTVLGYLAVASLALAVILLIFYLIAGWLKFH